MIEMVVLAKMVELLILTLIVLMLYLLPAIVGSNKKDFEGILILNIFLGWTFIGWVIALIWAVSSEKNGNQ
jgi:uncharacterized membrane protein YccC